jgi:hypothetical protein
LDQTLLQVAVKELWRDAALVCGQSKNFKIFGGLLD